MIKRVNNDTLADLCDILLTKLIQDERKYDNSISNKFIVRDYFKKIIRNKNNILLAKIVNESIIGYIYLKPIKNDINNGYIIDGLYIEEEYRNKGIAKELIKESLNILKSNNIKFIDINVMYNNEIAKALYKSFGFKEFKVQMRHDI